MADLLAEQLLGLMEQHLRRQVGTALLFSNTFAKRQNCLVFLSLFSPAK